MKGFVNLGYAAMQLAAPIVLVQLERPLGALFAGGSTRHHPAEMAALVDPRARARWRRRLSCDTNVRNMPRAALYNYEACSLCKSTLSHPRYLK